jgi:glucosyl-3-phosphoglycerate synthase
LPELPTLLRQFQAKGEQYEQIVYEIFEEERPPMIEVDAYGRIGDQGKRG